MIFTALAGRCHSTVGDGGGRPLQAVLKQRALLDCRGRDTSQPASAISRAVVETVAEGYGEMVSAPLFFLLLGGAPPAMAYKAVNTLDSMVGYKHEKIPGDRHGQRSS